MSGDEIIYHVNVPYILVNDQIRNLSGIMKSFAKGMFPRDWTLFVPHRANDLIWGYPDPVLTKLKAIGQSSIDQFGYFLGQNGSDSKIYEIYDGSFDIRDLTKIAKWNQKESLDPIWNTNSANRINGTDGNNLAPLLGKKNKL